MELKCDKCEPFSDKIKWYLQFRSQYLPLEGILGQGKVPARAPASMDYHMLQILCSHELQEWPDGDWSIAVNSGRRGIV
jgi:hypothetical protein